MTETVRIISFPGTGNTPIFIGKEKGLFEKHGVEVALETTPSSMYQAQKLVAGEFDMACTAMDNVIAYQENAGEAELSAEPDLFIIASATQIEVSFVVAPEIESYEDVKSKKLALDALSTGFAFALYRMLDHAGLTSDDYEMVSVGSTPSRWEAVQKGEYAGTLLIEPFTGMARGQGYRVLGSTLEEAVFGHYPGQVFTASRAWAAQHGDAISGFLRGWLDAVDWIKDEANTEEAGSILAANMPQMNPKAIPIAVQKLRDPKTGLVPMAKFDATGLDTVLSLRSQYGPHDAPLTDPGKYVDLSYYDAAIKGR
jgi:ABC-type nitrate/sulfonate/bicarbonate transport system substrate-binding protein